MLAAKSLPVSSIRYHLQRVRMATTASSSSGLQTTDGSEGPVARSIREKASGTVSESVQSRQHRHHAAMRAAGGGNGETHFTVQVVSEGFRGKTTMQRHRMVYSALSDELSQGLHALSLKTKAPEES